MKKLTYKTLSIQNFLSVGNDAVTFDFQRGLSLITGRNLDNPERVNGIGKSAIVEAYYFALFGDTIRKIKKEFVVNNVTKGKGRVELTFDVETETETSSWKIIRQVKPSSVEVWRGDEDVTKSTIATNKDFVTDLIGSNSVICRSCDILSLSDNTPFMSKKAEEKRTFVNDIFSLEVFGKMLKDLKKMVSENKTETGISSAKIEEINHSIQTIQKQQEAYVKQLEERERVLNERKENVQRQIDSTEIEIKGIVIGDTEKLESDKEKLEAGWAKLDGKIGSIGSEISADETKRKLKISEKTKASSVEGVKCDKCLQDIPHTHIEHLTKVKESLTLEIQGFDENLIKLGESKNDLLRKKTLIQRKVAEVQQGINEVKLSKQKLASLEKSLKEYQENLKNLVADTSQPEAPIFDQSMKDTEERKKKETETFTLLKQHSEDLDMCKFILSEDGVKSFAVKKLIGMLNASIQNYIHKLGMTMRCKFDEYFEEAMTNDKGKEISYWNLSGGERRTVDLACAWAFKDIKQKISGTSSNLEFNDEIFDAAFDERGLDLLIEVIKERIDRYNLSVYAISHRKETFKHVDGEIVNLEKDGGITRRVS